VCQRWLVAQLWFILDGLWGQLAISCRSSASTGKFTIRGGCSYVSVLNKTLGSVYFLRFFFAICPSDISSYLEFGYCLKFAMALLSMFMNENTRFLSYPVNYCWNYQNLLESSCKLLICLELTPAESMKEPGKFRKTVRLPETRYLVFILCCTFN